MVYNMLMIPEIHTVCIILWHREGHKGMEGGRGWNINLLAQRLKIAIKNNYQVGLGILPSLAPAQLEGQAQPYFQLIQPPPPTHPTRPGKYISQFNINQSCSYYVYKLIRPYSISSSSARRLIPYILLIQPNPYPKNISLFNSNQSCFSTISSNCNHITFIRSLDLEKSLKAKALLQKCVHKKKRILKVT